MRAAREPTAAAASAARRARPDKAHRPNPPRSSDSCWRSCARGRRTSRRASVSCRAFRDAAPRSREGAPPRVLRALQVAVSGVAAAPDGRVITGSDDMTVTVWRDGACERTFQADTAQSSRWRCCRAERASSAPRTTAPRSCGRSTALSSAPSRWATRRVHCVAALPDGVHFVVGLGCDHDERRRGPAVPRRRDARPRLQAAVAPLFSNDRPMQMSRWR